MNKTETLQKRPDQPSGIAPNSTFTKSNPQVSGEVIEKDGERWYGIRHVEQMPGFLMTMASDSDHWLFLSSTGSMTAGRINPDHALFPYYTQDKLEDITGKTGGGSRIRVEGESTIPEWEPFTELGGCANMIERHIRKNELGNHIVMEEVHSGLALACEVSWRPSGKFGFVRKLKLTNLGDERRTVRLLDGLRSILPAGLGQRFMNEFSNLANAYQQAELDPQDGMALYHLSSVPTDLAEPKEALRATMVWQSGLEATARLLSDEAGTAFLEGGHVSDQVYVRGRRGTYIQAAKLTLGPGESREWYVCADVEKDASAVEAMKSLLAETKDLAGLIEKDCLETEQRLSTMLARADGIQCTGDARRTMRHTSNTLFNIMRGGTFPTGYRFPKEDLLSTVKHFNRDAVAQLQALLAGNDELTATDIWTGDRLAEIDNPDLLRLLREYLPLSFSRRHGDPSRPWNRFSIEIRNGDGSPRYAYQGNWRDIFQNWEALMHSYPEYCEAAICRFLNATTMDGHNPYRLTKDGFDWEVINPDDPWANIGYWGDHQIIYLLRLLEASVKFHPKRLQDRLAEETFVYAEVPYRIRSYEDMLRDPRETVDYDTDWANRIEERVRRLGSDGKLARTPSGEILHVSLLEKLLAPLVAKLASFIPDGGIWMNTQRPEWNDANNALVGSGVSVVTLGYIARYLRFLTTNFKDVLEDDAYPISSELAEWIESQKAVFAPAPGNVDDQSRRHVMDQLGQPASAYRQSVYDNGPSGNKVPVKGASILAYLEQALRHVDDSLRSNKRTDNLYHSYNLVGFGNGEARITRLNVMLEGQVSILSAGLLEPAEAVTLLDALRCSDLYREDQNSYILYPNRDLPRFMAKNSLDMEAVKAIPLLAEMLDCGDTRLVCKLPSGKVAFNADFHNAKDVDRALKAIGNNPKVMEHRGNILDLFESTFNHHAFTGRSGTFFAYEGLGSIYWHMVSKLALAVQENCLECLEKGPKEQFQPLLDHYREIVDGLGVHKDPAHYGAFPTDAYSHTPAHAGAQQPGMTGQVKEDILTRLCELGLSVDSGRICFNTALLDKGDFLSSNGRYTLPDADQQQVIDLEEGSLAYSFCGIPVIYLSQNGSTSVTVVHADGREQVIDGLVLPEDISMKVFQRTGEISRLIVQLTVK